jgi:hypothetical protein
LTTSKRSEHTIHKIDSPVGRMVQLLKQKVNSILLHENQKLSSHHNEFKNVRIVQPVRIRVRLDLPHPHVCRKTQLVGGGPSDETGETEALCHSRCGTMKIPPCSKALSAEHRPNFF